MTQTDTLWRQFATRLEAYLAARINNPEDVADLLQETFLRCHRAPPPEGVAPAAWLYRIVKNLIVDHYRARGPAWAASEEEPVERERFEVRESEQVVAGWLRDFAADLPEKYAGPLIAADFEGAGMKDVADQFGLSVSGAKSRVQRARKLLMGRLQDCCAFQLDEYGRVAAWARREPKPCPRSCGEG